MANSGQLKANWSNKYSDACWSFEWVSTPDTNNNSTTVEWNLYARGYSNSLYGVCEIYLNGSDTALINMKNDLYSFNNKKHAYGTFKIDHNNQGQGSFTLKMVGRIYEKQNPLLEKSQTFYLDPTQTPCYWDSGAFITINKTYVAPTGALEVGWGGAIGGTANGIISYNIEYSIDGTDWISFSAAQSPHTLSLGLTEDDRGKQLYIRVGIVGETIETPVYKDLPQNCFINVRPNKPTLTDWSGKDTNNIISNQAEAIEFGYSVPTKNTQQNLTTRFQIDEGEWITGGSQEYELSLNGMANSFSVRAATFDEEEYSEPVTLEFTKNSNLVSSAKLYLWEDESFILDFVFPNDKSPAAVWKGNYTGTIILTESNGGSKSEWTYEYTESAAIDVRALYDRDEDLIEGSQHAFLISWSITDGVDTYTPESELSISVSVPNIFHNSPYGSGYFSSDGSDYEWGPNTEDPYSDRQWYKGQVGEVVNKQITKVYMYHQDHRDQLFAIVLKKPWKQIQKLNVNLAISKEEAKNFYKPYSQALVVSGTLEDINWSIYGLDEAPTMQFWFGEEETERRAYEASASVGEENKLTYTISGTDAYYIAEGLEGKQILWYSYIDNANAEVSQRAQTPILLDFSEKAEKASAAGLSLTADEAELFTIGLLKQNMPLLTNLQVAAFTEPKAWLEFSKNKGATWNKIGECSNVLQTGQTSKANKFNIPAQVYSIGSFTVGKIEIQESVSLRIVVDTNATDSLAVEYGAMCTLVKHTEPIAEFESLEYFEEDSEEGLVKGFRGKCQFLQRGYQKIDNIATRSSIRLSIKEVPGITLSGALDDWDEFEIIITNGQDWNSSWTGLTIAPVITTEVGLANIPGYSGDPYVSTDYTREANYEYFVCYNVAPTVSYRQNHIGINTRSIDAEDFGQAVAVISQYNERDKLVFIGGGNRKASVSLSNGGMSGFIIDAGSWDGTPGGIIPSNPDIPVGLAQIAYTGEFSDLQQQKTIEIIISGGGAPV